MPRASAAWRERNKCRRVTASRINPTGLRRCWLRRCRKCGSAQAFLALDNLFEPPLERGLGAQCLPDRQKSHKHCERCEQDNRVVESYPRRQPIGNAEVLEASAPHISNRAILIMMKTPVP